MGGPPDDPATVPLVRVTRGGVQDNLHRGVVVAVSDGADEGGTESEGAEAREGEVLLAFGDPATRAYIRSAAKPIQALPVILSGAADAYGFDDADLAIICGSHKGGEPQVAQVRSILAKAGLTEAHLRSGSGIADNCSGKHAGMLAASRHLGYDLDGYLERDHPHQVSITGTLARVCGLAPGEVHVGTDGCGAPIHYISVYAMALGYARMSRPERSFDGATADAVMRVTRAMTLPLGGHTGEPGYATALGAARFLTKGGGNGIYCAGVIGRGRGFAAKVEDGSSLPLKPLFIEVMRRLGALSDVEAGRLAREFAPEVVNRRGNAVGGVELLLPE